MTVVATARRIAASLLVALLCGCATTAAPPSADTSEGQRADPWEPVNRKIYSFNEAIDNAVLKPVAKGYRAVTPAPVRQGVYNFFGNFEDLWSAANHFLQGRLESGLNMGMRVATNTTFGLAGLLDVAGEIGLERQRQDFGLTLAHWGFAPGPYVVWPLLGPSTVRDSVGLPLELAASPATLVDDAGARWALSGLRLIDTRARFLGATAILDDIALDKYSFVRDAYLARRRSLQSDREEPAPREDESAP